MGVMKSNDSKVAPSESQKTCTWKELALHNTENDCWVAIDGKVYDVTEWLDKHPGGKDYILMASGRDITNLFQSYHPFSDKPSLVLKKYFKCNMSNTELPRYVSKSPFYETLKKRVQNCLEVNKIDRSTGFGPYFRFFMAYVLLFTGFYFTHFWAQGFYTSIFFAILFGHAEALFGLHILHDSCHASIGHNPKLWHILGSTFDWLVGAGYFSWIHQHVLGHHVYTNVRNADPDLGEGDVDFRRVSPYQPKAWYYRYQHIYAPLMYCILSVKFRIQDLDVFTKRINGQIRVGPPSLFFRVSYFVGKFTFLFWRLCIPILFGSQSLGRIFFLFGITEIVSGYHLALTFQVSHIATGLEYLATPMPPNAISEINEDWAIMQVRTTQDYAHSNAITTYLTGALNYQVVHHLFPSISQSYYPLIGPIVVKTCKEFGVKYTVLPDFTSAFISHLTYLKQMGDPSAPYYETPENEFMKKEA